MQVAGPFDTPECDGAYTYECIQEKVTIALNTLTNNLKMTKETDIEVANDLKEESFQKIERIREE